MRKVTKEKLTDMILKGESIDDVDYSDITNMRYMFNGCSSLVEIPKLDTSKVTNMYAMFEGCSSLVEMPELDTSKVTDMRYMFNGCTSLVHIEDPLSFHLYDWKELNNPILKEKYPELYI